MWIRRSFAKSPILDSFDRTPIEVFAFWNSLCVINKSLEVNLSAKLGSKYCKFFLIFLDRMTLYLLSILFSGYLEHMTSGSSTDFLT